MNNIEILEMVQREVMHAFAIFTDELRKEGQDADIPQAEIIQIIEGAASQTYYKLEVRHGSKRFS